MDNTGELIETDHSHCLKCVLRHCRFNNGCVQMQCHHNCGAVFHACKEDEHALLCPKEMCDCLNILNGCPLKMTREKLSMHLHICPASVIHCSMEWNRWPVYSKERKARVPFSQDNLHARYGQLDVALALRDQRMLNAALKAPRKIRRSLRNNLTQRFPAVPFLPPKSESDFMLNDVSESTSPAGSDDESDTPWAASKCPPGLLKSVCDELFATQNESNKLSPVPESNDKSEVQFVNENVSEDFHDIAGKLTLDPLPELDCSHPPPPAPPPSLTLQSILGLDINVECITRYQSKPKSMYTFLCAKNVRRDEYNWHFRNVHCDIHSCLNGWLEQRCPLANYGCTYSQRRLCAGNPESEVIYNGVIESFGLKVKQFNTDHRHQSMIYDKQWKEKTPEIFTSSNFDSIVQIDGNLGNVRKCRESLSPFEDNLCSLPFEILRHICMFLDSFSLCNMAMTCKTLRQVVSSMLEDRGIVILEWLCKTKDGRPHWYTGYKRWMFSNSFTPVTKWKFEQPVEAMAKHLASCPFYQKEPKLLPFALAGTDQHNTPGHVIEVLQRMYPDMAWDDNAVI